MLIKSYPSSAEVKA